MLGQESGNVLGYYYKAINEFKVGFDADIEMSFSFGDSERFKCDRLDGLSLRV